MGGFLRPFPTAQPTWAVMVVLYDSNISGCDSTEGVAVPEIGGRRDGGWYEGRPKVVIAAEVGSLKVRV